MLTRTVLVFHVVLLFLTECDSGKSGRYAKHMKDIQRFFTSGMPKTTTSKREILDMGISLGNLAAEKGGNEVVGEKFERRTEKERFYRTIYPPKPPRNYTNPMIFPRLRIRFLIVEGFILNFTDVTKYDNIHDAYVQSLRVFNKRTNEIRAEVRNIEFIKQHGLWFCVLPLCHMLDEDTIFGTIFYMFCTYEDDYRHYAYKNYTKDFQISVHKNNVTGKFEPEYHGDPEEKSYYTEEESQQDVENVMGSSPT